MKVNRLIILIVILLFNFNAYSQSKKCVQLFDSYSREIITIDSTFKLINRKFKINKTNNLIELHFSFRKKLVIESIYYDTFSENVNFNRKDTVTLQLTPNESTITKRFSEIWNIENKTNDTLTFKTLKSLQDFTSSYLNYLSALKKNCDNGMCNYSNSYSYIFYFSHKDAVFQMEKIEPKVHYDYKCPELEDNIKLLKEIFPKFKLLEKTDAFYFQYLLLLR